MSSETWGVGDDSRQLRRAVVSGARDAGGAATEAMVEAGARALLIARGAGLFATDAEWPSTLDRHRRLSDDFGAFHREIRSLLADAFRDARVAITAAAAVRPAPAAEGPEMVAAAWRAFRGERKGMLLGPGPGFMEAIDAALALRPAQPEADALREEVGRLRAALTTAEEAIASACRQRDASDRALAETRGVLRQVEFDPGGVCPSCFKFEDHAPGCALAAQLAADPGPGTAGASTGGDGHGG